MTTRTLTNPIRLPRYLSQLVDYFPVPNHSEELKLIRKAKKGHQKSLTWLMVANARLVCKLANHYAFLVLDAQDLIQEGILGIHHAIRKFDPKKGARFGTYIRSWVLHYIRRFCYRNRLDQLRLPEEHQINLDRVKRLAAKYFNAGLTEIADRANLSLDYVQNLLLWGRSLHRLNAWDEIPCYDDSPLDEDEILDLSAPADDDYIQLWCCSPSRLNF